MIANAPIIIARARSYTLRRLHVRWLFASIWATVFFFHAVIYLALIPPWQAPDEPTSIELLLTMQLKGWLVSEADKEPAIEQEIIQSMQRSRYWERGAYGQWPEGANSNFKYIYPCCHTQLHRPPLYHVLALPVAEVTQGWLIEDRILMFRAISVLFGVLTVIIVSLISYELVDIHSAFPLILPSLVALQPQFAYSSAIFNSDILATLFVSLSFLICIRLAKNGFSIKRVTVIVATIILGFLTKRTTMFVVPGLVVFLCWEVVLTWKGGDQQTRQLITKLGIFLTGSIIALFTIPQLLNTSTLLVKKLILQSSLQHYQSFIFDRLFFIHEWLPTSIPFLNKSFWGSFGWHQIYINNNISNVLLALICSAWASALIAMFYRRWPTWIGRYLCFCIITIVVSIILTLVNAPRGILPQGRYLFVSLVPIMTLTSFGLIGWLSRRWSSHVITTVWLLLFIFDCYTIIQVVIPGFYQ